MNIPHIKSANPKENIPKGSKRKAHSTKSRTHRFADFIFARERSDSSETPKIASAIPNPHTNTKKQNKNRGTPPDTSVFCISAREKNEQKAVVPAR
ncbi:hypothetical protein [Ruminococcus sp. YE71]|uniref:hypothetical protein n=1 Tax=Ruminococcus sp. YE71 TaxID=244362 RepID=UPI000B30BC39|nr:hypothetical protein [Ruminococcus sp. YE71]